MQKALEKVKKDQKLLIKWKISHQSILLSYLPAFFFNISPNRRTINDEFKYFNIYRSTSYFRDVNGMSPYVSGKLDKLLQSPGTNSYKDLYPTPNTNWYYAVTMVNGEGQEEKTVDSKKVRFKKSSSLYITIPCLKNGFQLSHLVVYLDRTCRKKSEKRERKEREGSW